jgi:hypothetical protein
LLPLPVTPKELTTTATATGRRMGPRKMEQALKQRESLSLVEKQRQSSWEIFYSYYLVGHQKDLFRYRRDTGIFDRF